MTELINNTTTIDQYDIHDQEKVKAFISQLSQSEHVSEKIINFQSNTPQMLVYPNLRYIVLNVDI